MYIASLAGATTQEKWVRLTCDTCCEPATAQGLLPRTPVEAAVVVLFACVVAGHGYEYSRGFVMAISELRISGVLGVVQTPPSMPSSGGTVRLRLELYILGVGFFQSFVFSL